MEYRHMWSEDDIISDGFSMMHAPNYVLNEDNFVNDIDDKDNDNNGEINYL